MGRFPKISYVVKFHILLNFFVVIFITGASYYHMPFQGFKDASIYILHFISLQITVAGFLYFLSLNKWIFKIFFSILFIIFCGFSFWAYSQDISVTEHLIHSVIETKPDIAYDLITLPYLGYLFLSFLALFFLLKRYKKIDPLQGIKWLILPAILCVSLFFILENKRPGNLINRLPYNLVFGLNAYTIKSNFKLDNQIPSLFFQKDAIKVVFVLGESVRADHLGINGYSRNTTPQLALEENLMSFPNLYTKHTYTGASVPQILTNQALEDTMSSYLSIYSVANKGGFNTTWIGNQTLEKSFTPVVNTNKNIVLIDKYKSVFSFNKERDESLLQPFDSVLKIEPRSLTTLHMIGSHWWYENRYTDKERTYTPVIDSKYIPSLTNEQLINSYDNTILYLDNFLNSILEKLKNESKPSVLVYVSDHGEQLGEDNKWLHAQAGDAAKNPAYLIWYSNSYKEKYPETIQYFQRIKNDPLSTDVLFYHLLDIMGIKTD
ncbi:MAG: lipid A ethanolaminephosphotransferase [Flavobacteriaceae bacterium]|jgi:lipid A ethanolaminephosphotransferase